MRAPRLLLPTLLVALSACGGAKPDPAAEAAGAVYASFVGAGARGDFRTWAGHLAPEIRAFTAGPIARWLAEKSAGTAAEGRARELLAKYGLSDPETFTDAFDGDWDRAAFLGAAIPLVLEGMSPEESRALRSTLVPPPGPLSGFVADGDTANATVRGDGGERQIVFLRVDGVWKLVSF